jgi:hypothetical protein
MTFDQMLYYYYGFNEENRWIDLQAGMRLRVDYQSYQLVHPATPTAGSGYVGSGTSYYQVNSYNYTDNLNNSRRVLGFDAFLASIPLEPIGSLRSYTGGILQLQQQAFRRPYYRLIYPSIYPSSDGWEGIERNPTLIGADTLADLQAASGQYLSNGRITDPNVAAFYFHGQATVIPEIAVFVQEQPVYVPVGTTIRQVLERFSAIPAAGFLGEHRYQGSLRPRRLVHEGINSTPEYKYIELNHHAGVDNEDEFDLPVVKGDRFYL